MLILFHSSKTMKPRVGLLPATEPLLQNQAEWLMEQIVKLTVEQLATEMKISVALAAKVRQLHQAWLSEEAPAGVAAATFVGDMYSGLQVAAWNEADWRFAADHLRILSGLYGVLSPTDLVKPYRLEMAYKLTGIGNLYDYWSAETAKALPETDWILNLSVPEYTEAVLPYMSEKTRVIRPTFLTLEAKSGQPKPVVVHAKVARGAMADWVIRHRVTEVEGLQAFDALNYVFDDERSIAEAPVFVCSTFGGLGLSVRLD